MLISHRFLKRFPSTCLPYQRWVLLNDKKVADSSMMQEHRDSGSLKNYLVQQTTSLDSDPDHIYVHVKNVMDRMKLYRKEVEC